jgi:hypothetical protein
MVTNLDGKEPRMEGFEDEAEIVGGIWEDSKRSLDSFILRGISEIFKIERAQAIENRCYKSTS